MSLSAAERNVRFARMNLESRRYDDIARLLDAAEEELAEVTDEDTTSVRDEVAELRTAAATAIAEEQYGYKIRAAQRQFSKAKSDIEAGNIMPSGIADTIQVGIGYLDGLPDDIKAPLLAEAETLRGLLRLDAPPPPESPAPAAAAASAPSDDHARTISIARGKINACRSSIESRRDEGVSETLDEIVDLLGPVEEVHKETMLADIAALRVALAENIAAERIRRIESEFTRHFAAAEEDIETLNPTYSAQSIAHLTRRMEEDDVRNGLPADMYEQYRARLEAAKANRTAALKANGLKRALPYLTDLEERLRIDPFAGLDQYALNSTAGELRSLQDRTRHELQQIAENDADRRDIEARLAAADEKIGAALTAWSKSELYARVRETWTMIEREVEGWEQETNSADAGLLSTPVLDKTRTAIMRIRYLLDDPQTQQIRAENPGDATIEGIYGTAEAVLEAAAAKLAEAYYRVVAEAEQAPVPMSGYDAERPLHLTSAAEVSFAGTPQAEQVIARIRQLEERWQAEREAILQGRQDLYDKLAVEAEAAWPAIVEATGATTDFNPRDPSAVGRTVLLAGVYNRAGWDFNDCSFSMRLDGVPIGGNYEAHVLEALEHAWYELKLDVNDRIRWDVIGVVQGPGKLGERTVVTVRNDSNLEIGKIEEWRPVECVWLRIIALHAGPVAVGPKQ
jgi:hypothetical protein